jgi:hypothetical protein
VLSVFAVLVATVIFLSLFRPKSPEILWRRFSEAFATDRRLRAYPFKHESVFLRHVSTRNPLQVFVLTEPRHGQYAHFDVGLDDRGIWFLFDGPASAKCAASIFVPWVRVRFAKNLDNYSCFTFLARKPVGVTIRRALGDEIIEYMSR